MYMEGLMDKNSTLHEIAKRALPHIFVESAQTEENIPEALGVLIAKYCEWEGKDIAKIFVAALEDANYHAECTEIEEIFGL